MSLYAGTSGFSYPAWRGRFYPPGLPAGRMLAHYALHLNGVELNGTFYRTPAPEAFRGWLAATPEGFRLCCKAHRGLTYSSPAFDKEGLARLLGPQLAALGPRLGPVLLQFPPTRTFDRGLLEGLLAALALRAAVEFRHESWFGPETYAVLARHGAAMVVTEGERWPAAPALDLAPFAYHRLRRAAYSRAQLRRLRGDLRARAAGLEEVHAYFRHDPEAPFWARFMLE